MSDRERDDHAVLAALVAQGEADEAAEDVGTLTPEQAEKELAAAGVDVAKGRARAEGEAARFRAVAEARPARRPALTRRAWWVLLSAALFSLVFLLLARPTEPDVGEPPTASPATLPDSGTDLR
jgi:hypothetical protein